MDLVKGYHIMAGYDNLVYGARVPGIGSDGIMPGDSRLASKKTSAVEKKGEGVEAELLSAVES